MFSKQSRCDLLRWYSVSVTLSVCFRTFCGNAAVEQIEEDEEDEKAEVCSQSSYESMTKEY